MNEVCRTARQVIQRLTVGPAWVQARYGTGRGLLRLALSWAGLGYGAYARFATVDWQQVSRLVFVCRGNVCRSAYAEQRALQLGLACCSCGTRAASGSQPDDPTLSAARRHGVTLNQHRARTLAEIAVQPGDLLLAMEPEQARVLQTLYHGKQAVQVTLLGLWSRPPRPHIHDPHQLAESYLDTAFRVIDSAVGSIAARLGTRRDV